MAIILLKQYIVSSLTRTKKAVESIHCILQTWSGNLCSRTWQSACSIVTHYQSDGTRLTTEVGFQIFVS